MARAFLLHRKHRVRVNSEYSNFMTVIGGIPQSSIIWLLRLNVTKCGVITVARGESLMCYRYVVNEDIDSTEIQPLTSCMCGGGGIKRLVKNKNQETGEIRDPRQKTKMEGNNDN